MDFRRNEIISTAGFTRARAAFSGNMNMNWKNILLYDTFSWIKQIIFNMLNNSVGSQKITAITKVIWQLPSQKAWWRHQMETFSA